MVDINVGDILGVYMLLTAKLKLLPSVEQRAALLQTMKRYNEACNKVSAIAYHDHDWNKFRLQKKMYAGLRQDYHLPAQLTIRSIKKVCDSYKANVENIRIRNQGLPRDKPREILKQQQFKIYGAIAYDARCLSWKGRDHVSILTLGGRIKVPIVLSGKNASHELENIRGKADLIYWKKQLYLVVVYEIEEQPSMTVIDYIGVDMGYRNLLSTSDGKMYSGDACERNRKNFVRKRSIYQAKGTKSAHKHLSKIKRSEANFKVNENHRISKDIVVEAKGTGRGIALEELTHIPDLVTANKVFNDGVSKWAFRQLRSYIEYKAKLAGVPVVLVNPAHTSQKCSQCGFVHEDNRTSQSSFVCLRCGHTEHADINAAKNIRDMARAVVIRPMVVRHAAEV
jgi:IS605 OrfB family transposase